jgi:Ca-activated chloride channel family protein
MDRATLLPRSRILFGLAALVLCAAALANGQAADAIRSGTLVFTVADGEPVVIPQLRTDVNVTVDGIVARVEVRQRFRNPSDQWAEGIYAFPVPANASVERISTVQDGKLVSDVRRKVGSQRLYDSARAGSSQQPSSKASSRSLFRAPIADIAPRATVDITLGYVQIIDHSLDRHRLRVPLAANLQPLPDLSVEGELSATPATADGWLQIAEVAAPARQSDSGGQAVSVSVRIDSGGPLTAITSRHHAVQVTAGTPATITTRTERAAADEDFVLEWSPDPRQTRLPLARAAEGGTRLLPIAMR